MCVYCMCDDWAKKYAPDYFGTLIGPVTHWPWPPLYQPVSPAPAPWTREQLDQFEDILAKIKEMEDRLGGCPCEEPEKMDYLKVIRQRLDYMDKKISAKKAGTVRLPPVTVAYDPNSTIAQPSLTSQMIIDFLAKYPQNYPLTQKEAEDLTKDQGKVFIGGMTVVSSKS